jgi:N-acetylneuraminate synthase/sialic acid synthase
MVRDLKRVHEALGNGEKHVYEEEVAPLIKMGKKLVASRNIKMGEVLQANDIAVRSPGDGLPPYEISQFIGKKLKIDISLDEDFTFKHV